MKNNALLLILWVALLASCQCVTPVSAPEVTDNDPTTCYTGVGKVTKLLLDAPADAPVLSYKVYSSGERPQYDPAEWSLKGSNDGKTWDIVDQRQGQLFCSRFQEILCAVQLPAAYKHYQLEARTASGDTLKIAEVMLSERNLLAGWEDFNYPEVNFNSENPDTEGARVYLQLVQNPEEYVKYHTQKVAEILFYTARDEMNDVRQINYTLRDYDGISAKGGNPPAVNIVYSTRHVEKSVQESLYKLDYETRGVLYHELVHAYQFEPKGIGTYSTNKEFWACIEGVADAVRTEAGLFDIDALRKPGGHWLDGYKTTGFFLHWLTGKDPEFIRKFHLTVRDLDVWSFDKAMKSLFGEEATIQGLWDEYQQFLTNNQ